MTVIIGSDEVLKGDTFGGIVVAAIKADENTRKVLFDLGVQDSKKIVDAKIKKLAPEIEKRTDCIVKNVFPQEYNSYPKNMTALLNDLHRECGNELRPGMHVVDKYPGCSVGDIILEKAESKHIEVAAASIVARYHALNQLAQLEKEIGFKIPKGSTHVSDALERLKKSGLDPKKFVKLNFKNVQKALF